MPDRKVIEYNENGELKDPIGSQWMPDDDEDDEGMAVQMVRVFEGRTDSRVLDVTTLRARYENLVAMWQRTFYDRGEQSDCCDQRTAMAEMLEVWEQWSDERAVGNGSPRDNEDFGLADES